MTTYKYFGIHLDNGLTWNVQVDCVCSRVQQRLHFLWRMRVFGVTQKMMLIFYSSIVECILHNAISVLFVNLSVQLKVQITQMIMRGIKIMGARQDTTKNSFHISAVSFTMNTSSSPYENDSITH